MRREDEHAEIKRMQRINRIGARTLIAMVVLLGGALVFWLFR